MQPWRAFKPDGVILFSDILTPLAGMGIDFDIVQGKGPIIADPIRTLEVCLAIGYYPNPACLACRPLVSHCVGCLGISRQHISMVTHACRIADAEPSRRTSSPPASQAMHWKRRSRVKWQ